MIASQFPGNNLLSYVSRSCTKLKIVVTQESLNSKLLSIHSMLDHETRLGTHSMAVFGRPGLETLLAGACIVIVQVLVEAIPR